MINLVPATREELACGSTGKEMRLVGMGGGSPLLTPARFTAGECRHGCVNRRVEMLGTDRLGQADRNMLNGLAHS